LYTHIYNQANHLVEVKQGVSTIAAYAYNAEGQRVSKASGGIASHYVYDTDDHLIGIYDAVTGVAKEEIIYFGDVPVATHRDGSFYYIHTDHLGTPRLVSDQSQSIVWRWDSTPFGDTIPDQDPDADGANFIFNFRFPGQYFDAETGLHYNYLRTYDPGTGRYLESDPIGLTGGLNTYAYVEGNPISYYDPFGLAKLPNDPSGLGDGWSKDHGHRNPNGEKWDHDSGRSVEWHPGQPGKPGWRGKDHWHVDGGKEHLPPGTDVPGLPGSDEGDQGDEGDEGGQCGEDSACRMVATTFVVGGTAYVIYRCVRMIPSLFPPLWPTIPANAAIP
jgi:RHS repeat-associated protein